jgi:hypothetical protein
MPLKVDHYAALSRAIALLDSDSYAARGEIYDRARKELLQRLTSANPPYSTVEIAKEKRAFKEAVWRIEFDDIGFLGLERLQGNGISPATPRDLDEVGAAASRREPPAEDPEESRDIVVRDEDRAKPKRERRPIFGRIASGMVMATVLLGVVGVVHAYTSGNIELPWLSRFINNYVVSADIDGDANSATVGGAVTPQRAVLYDEDSANPMGKALFGEAVWRVQPEQTAPGRKPEAVVTLDLTIPERGLLLKMSVRRNPDKDAAISHFVEFSFLGSKNLPVDAVVNVLGLLMKKEERSRGTELVGKTIQVAPGVFLFGLSGTATDMEKNVRLLKDQAWLDVPIVYKNGARSILAIEKGRAGDRAIAEAFTQWAQL